MLIYLFKTCSSTDVQGSEDADIEEDDGDDDGDNDDDDEKEFDGPSYNIKEKDITDKSKYDI